MGEIVERGLREWDLQGLWNFAVGLRVGFSTLLSVAQWEVEGRLYLEAFHQTAPFLHDTASPCRSFVLFFGWTLTALRM